MAWTDVSTAPGNDAAWTGFGTAYNNSSLFVSTAFPTDTVFLLSFSTWFPGSLNQYGTGMDGFAPTTPDPIANNIDQGGGGPVRPSSGFLYPRGDN